jgi:hypothetical protein
VIAVQAKGFWNVETLQLLSSNALLIFVAPELQYSDKLLYIPIIVSRPSSHINAFMEFQFFLDILLHRVRSICQSLEAEMGFMTKYVMDVEEEGGGEGKREGDFLRFKHNAKSPSELVLHGRSRSWWLCRAEIRIELFQHFKEQDLILVELLSSAFGVAVRMGFVMAVNTAFHLRIRASLEYMGESIEKLERWVDEEIRNLIYLEVNSFVQSDSGPIVCYHALGGIRDLQHSSSATMLSKHALQIVGHRTGKVHSSVSDNGGSDKIEQAVFVSSPGMRHLRTQSVEVAYEQMKGEKGLLEIVLALGLVDGALYSISQG